MKSESMSNMTSNVESAKKIAELQVQLEKLNEKFDKLTRLVEQSIKQHDEVSTEMNVRLGMLTGVAATTSTPVPAPAAPAKKKAAEPGVKTTFHASPPFMKAMILADLANPEKGTPFLIQINTLFKCNGVGIYDHVAATEGESLAQLKTPEKIATSLYQIIWKLLTEDQRKEMGVLRTKYNQSVGGSREELQVEPETAIEAAATVTNTLLPGVMPPPDL